jgi:hypothetical protein
MARRYNASSPAPNMPRPRGEAARFFDGLEVTSPGLVNLTDWGTRKKPTRPGRLRRALPASPSP